MQPRWLSKSRDRGTSVEYSEHTTMAMTTSACSECSDLKEKLGDVTRRLEVQEVQVDTLRQLMESLRSSTLIVPPVPSPPGAMQTFTPVESPDPFSVRTPLRPSMLSRIPPLCPPQLALLQTTDRIQQSPRLQARNRARIHMHLVMYPPPLRCLPNPSPPTSCKHCGLQPRYKTPIRLGLPALLAMTMFLPPAPLLPSSTLMIPWLWINPQLLSLPSW